LVGIKIRDGYVGASQNFKTTTDDAQFIQMSGAGWRESPPTNDIQSYEKEAPELFYSIIE